MPVYVQTVVDRLRVFADVETDAVLTVDESVDLVTDEVTTHTMNMTTTTTTTTTMTMTTTTTTTMPTSTTTVTTTTTAGSVNVPDFTGTSSHVLTIQVQVCQ